MVTRVGTTSTQYKVNTNALIIQKGSRKHDYDIYKHNHPVTPPQVENVLDLGYLGVEKDFATVC